jgi:hypothetical protein
MHDHEGLPVRVFHVTLMDAQGNLPHKIQVDSPCDCDMWEFVQSLPDLPFVPAFMDVEEIREPNRVS